MLDLIQIGIGVTCGVMACAMVAAEPAKDPQKPFKLDKTIQKKVRLDYILYLPEDYGKDKNKQWPMVLFLHGAGERGSDVSKVKATGPPRMIADGKQFPFIMVSPQCPEDSWWDRENDALIGLIDEIQSKYKVDKNRIYLTGLSMGGYGTWALSTAEPKRFAAIAPICGGGNPKKASAIKDIPTWAFHGDADNVVPLRQSQDMIDAIKAAGGKPKFTVYRGVGHDSWTPTYANEEFWKWLLEQKKK